MSGLFEAAKAGKEKKVKELVNQGEDPNWENDVGATALHCAARVGNEKIVALLLDARAHVNHVQRTSQSTALHHACEAGRPKVVAALLQAGAIVDMENQSGTPLIKAAMAGDSQIVKLLIAEGAALQPTFNGKNAIEWAKAERRKECVRLLETAVSQPRDPLAGVFTAASCGNEGKLRQLLEHEGSAASRRAQDNFSDTSVAATAGGGRGIAWKDANGHTALHMAAAAGHNGCVELLLGARANVDEKQNWGVTPLIMACEVNKAATIKLLSEGGARLDLPDDNGVTALIKSAIAGHIEAVKVLLQKGADANLKYLNKTAVQWAKEEGHPVDLIKLLRQHTTSVT